MEYIRMILAFALTGLCVTLIYQKKDRAIGGGIIYFLFCVINDTFFAQKPFTIADFGPISYHVDDMILVVLGLVILIEFVKTRKLRYSIWQLPVWTTLGLLCVSAFRGLWTFRFSSEWVGDVRTIMTFMVVIIYFMLFYECGDIQKYLRWIHIAMAAVAIMTLLIWGLDWCFDIHPFASQIIALDSDGGSTMRFVAPHEVLVIAAYALYLIRNDLRKKGYVGVWALFYLLLVVLFQHRTVWIALFFGLMYLLIDGLRQRWFIRIFIFELVIAILLGVFLFLFSDLGLANNIRKTCEVIGSLFQGKMIEGTTSYHRINAWTAILDEMQGISNVIGAPFGFGYATSIGWKTSPHSGYFRMFGRTGYLGIILFVGLLVVMLIMCYRKKVSYVPECIMAVLGFMTGYDFNWFCGIVIGIGIAILASRANVVTKREDK